MLQTLNIPSSPLPEVPNAPPGAPGDAGERAEFAQLLQQAKAEPDAARDAPTVVSAKDARTDLRVRPNTPRSAQEHKPHDMRGARDRAEPTEADAEAADLAGCMKAPLTDALTVAADAVAQSQASKGDEPTSAAALPDAVVPTQMHASAPAITPPTQNTATLPSAADADADADEMTGSARASARTGGRDLRLPSRLESATAAPTDTAGSRSNPSIDSAASSTKDVAFDFALRQAGSGRGATPLFDRMPESIVNPSQAQAFARELHNPLARTDATAEATLHAAPDEAGFAPALGAQVSLWVKDGVQEARLQLHPAELGPVTVQIALEGQAAHIDFTAAVAATRESIEQSLPALAAALRESGFTLAGGGVFGRPGEGSGQRGRERTPEGRGAGSRVTGAIGTGDSAEASAALPRRWGRSLVDVYA